MKSKFALIKRKDAVLCDIIASINNMTLLLLLHHLIHIKSKEKFL